MNIKSIYEFLLWANCSNNCKFCWQKHFNDSNKFLSPEQKAHSIKSVQHFLQSDKFERGSHVLLVGGELFDSVITEEMRNMISFVVDMMEMDEIDLLYINTNLIYQDLSGLYFLLDKIEEKQLFHRLKFTTSYDLYGRFCSDEKQKLMTDNLQTIKSKYPDIKIVVNIILTKQACNQITNKDFSVKDFQNMYDIQVNTIPYIILHNNMAPTKEEVYKALLTIDEEISGYLKSYVENLDLPQDKILYEYTSGDINDLVFCSSDDNSACGHSVNFKKCFIDSDECFVCSVKKLLFMI